ncbi:His Kinase A (phosphoacceptor) domain [Rhizoctonia solani]|uniref:His Kinase A (Phosphoacceptor) domain n=1 Tax=Rhizoctonia solani TaxID=456999 RepID=A0A8H7IMM4_9AGAM|nr:His Kinase A (phosphoacceptor) domain [Rhizoctonia solani]
MLASRDLLRHVPLISFLDAYPEPAFILCTNTLPHSSLEFMYGNHALHSILFGHDDTAVLDDQGFFSALISDQDVFWLGDPLGSRSPITPHPSRTVAGDSRKITIRPDWLPRDHTPLDLELTPTPIDLPVIIPGVGSTTHSYVFIASPRRAPMNLLRSEAHTELQLRRDPGLRLTDFPPLPSSSGTRIRSRQSKSESTSWVSQPIPYVGVADLPSRMIETFPWEKTSLGPRESWPMTLKLMVKYLMEKPIPSCIFWSWPDQVMIYNDTYAKMIGSKHPGSFGQVGRIAWGELWDMLLPVSEQCRRGKSTRKNDGSFALTVPVGHPSDLFARPVIFQLADRTPPTRRGVSVSPFKGCLDDGTIGGVWNSTLETTQKVIAERRLSGISELSARMSDARTQEQFGERTMEVLSRNPIDLPFVALYWCEVENVSAIAAPAKYGAPALASTYLRHHTEIPTNVKLTLASSLGIPNEHSIARQVIKYTLDPVTYRPIQVLSEPDNIESPATVTEATPRLSMFGSPMGSVSSTIHLPPTSPTKGLELGIDLSKVFASGTVELIDPLPSQLAQGLDGRGFKDIPRAAALLPINMYSQNRSRHNGRLLPYAVLLVGLNTRRPYDADYASWLEGMAANLSNQLTVVLQREADMKLIEEQERIDKAKTMFFTNISHGTHLLTLWRRSHRRWLTQQTEVELRTPLTLIQAPLEQLAVSEGVSRDLHYKIHLAMRNCKRLKKLVDSIMDMSKLEAGRLVGSFRPVQLGRITADLAALFRSMAEKKGIEYQISCDMEDEPAVYVDLDLWEKIVCNLLSNAFKYTSKGRVGLSVTHDTLFSYVRVSDTGVGIPREHIDAVFERFFRAAEGTGVGLSLTKELVSLHGGHMSLSSQTEQEAPGESGSIFTVTLPHGCIHLPAALIHEGASNMNGISRREMEYWMEFEQPTPSSNASASDEAESATSSTLFFEKEDVVLVVDDNADMRAYIRKIFSPYLTVTEARNGIEALKVAMSQKINLILCDVMMPGMDGPEMLRRLRGERKTRLLPVIFVTASDDANLFGGQADGVVDCISKPFRVRDMLARVHLQLQLGKRRVRLEEDFEVRSHELQVLTDLSPVGIFRVDTNGKLMYVNPAWHQITGFPQERDRDEWIDHSVHPSSKSEMIRIWRACFEQEKSSSMRIQWNSNCWTHVAISPLVSPDGAMLGAFGAITDINEQHRAEEARIALAEEREHIAASKAEDAEAQRQLEVHLELLIDVTSHELRPNAGRTGGRFAGNGQYHTMWTGTRLAPLSFPGPSYRCSLLLARIANDVLSLSRIQLNVLSIIPTEFDIKQETSQILMVFRNELMSKDIGFELDLGRGIDIYGLQTISTDRSRYAQIITNLMSNAIRFTDMSTGSRHIKVALELSLDPPSDESCAPPPLRTGRSLSHSSMDFESNDLPVYVYVSVQDSGPGLQKEDLALLFQRFQQGSVSSSIRDLMGGRIEVVSHIGEGAIFRFFIKAAAAAGRIPRPPRPIGIRAKRSSSVQSKGSAVSKSSARSGHRPLPETPNLQNNRPLHVLITEDNKINQTVLARQMKRAGFTYALASNGLEAIQAIDKVDSQTEIPNDLSTRKFDMDLEMPVLDGFAATREIRRREAVHSLKTRSFIIALTGNARREQVQSARDAGVDDVMIKQVDRLKRFPADGFGESLASIQSRKLSPHGQICAYNSCNRCCCCGCQTSIVFLPFLTPESRALFSQPTSLLIMPAALSVVSIIGLAAVVTAQTTGVVPLTDKKYTWPDVPYQVSPEPVGRGPQFGFNICNSTTENQQSDCQTSFVNSIDDFCLWAPATPNSLIADTEAAEVAWCSKKGHGTRVIPGGALKGVQYLKTPDYVQITGFVDQSQINLQSDDAGGELDPHGADEQGNPLGGLIFSNAWSNGNNNSFTQVIEWTNFMGGNMFCLKICDPAGKNPAGYCEHIYDRIGCAYNAPAAYVNGTFEKCDSDSMELPGQYVSNGATVTYYQPPESLGPITSIPYTVAIPKSSNCVTYQSTDLYAAASTTAASSSPTATATGKAASQHASSGTASRSASGSGATSTSTANASVRDTQAISAWPAALMAGLVGFGGLLGVVAAL